MDCPAPFNSESVLAYFPEYAKEFLFADRKPNPHFAQIRNGI